MPSLSAPKPIPGSWRTLSLVCGLLAIGGIFIVLRALFLPSQYLSAYKSVEAGPRHAADLKKMQVLDTNHPLYLAGPVASAAGKKNTPLFADLSARPLLPPSTFTDSTGAVEVLTFGVPELAESIETYYYNEPVHMLGWRASESGFHLFLLSTSQAGLYGMLSKKLRHWKESFFIQMLILIALIFLAFWLLNLAVLSNLRLPAVQLMVVNLIFLILLYSALLLCSYPLISTLPAILLALGAANAVFIPLVLLFRPRNRSRQAKP